MATFPSIVPDERSYALGQVATEVYTGPGGVPYVFRTGTIQVGAEIEFPFVLRPISEVEAIWDHYHGQQRESFDLPSEVWCGHTAAATIASIGMVWVYIEEPKVERISAGFGSITVRLRASGVNLGPTVPSLPTAATYTGVTGSGVTPAGVLPQPIPDPPVIAPVITVAGPTETEIPSGGLTMSASVELRIGYLMETGYLQIGGEVELRIGHLMQTAYMQLGSSITTSTDEM